MGEVGYVSTVTFSPHMILIKERKRKNERKAFAGGRPGVDRVRKLSWNSNNAGRRWTVQWDAAISALGALFVVARPRQLAEQH